MSPMNPLPELEPELANVPILVVDDVADNRDLIEELLRDRGYHKVIQAADGESALALLQQHGDIGLVLLDVMMPGMDGYTICERITGDPATQHIPVIIVTGGAARRGQSFTRSFDAGAMDFLQKPIDETELVVRTRSALLLFRERRRCQAALEAARESQCRYELAVNGVNDGIWDLNLSTDCLYLSPQWEALLSPAGCEWPADKQGWLDCIHPDDRDAFESALNLHCSRRSALFCLEHRLNTPTGTVRWIYTRGRAVWDEEGVAIRIAGSSTDITARRELELQLRASQKWESIGRLAAGISHDFNNLLTVIECQSIMVEMQSAGSPMVQSAQTIHTAVQQASELCRRLLDYAGEGITRMETVDIGTLLPSIVDALRSSVHPGITMEVDVDGPALAVEADSAQIQQIVVNLARNAAEAIGEAEGRIQICAREVEPGSVDFTGSVVAPAEPEGSFVCLEIQDTGHGIPAEVRERIFDPFFTTKEQGRGLGLAAVLGIVRRHGGGLKVWSEQGAGASFAAFFPRAACCRTPAAPIEAVPALASTQPQGRVLLVDDDARVCMMVDALLGMLGFETLVANDGNEALEAFRNHQHEVDLALVDFAMPGINGGDLIAQLRTIDPGLPVILSSGYANGDVQEQLDRFEGVALLPKPYTIDQLKRLLGRGVHARNTGAFEVRDAACQEAVLRE